MDYSGFQKPFPEYRWKWASDEASEKLNVPEVYFGCLKVLHKNIGRNFSATEVQDDLRVIQNDLSDVLNSGSKPLNLVRETSRNLFRNMGQYWKFTGLLSSSRSGIQLSALGISYASGQVTKSEFASYIVKTLQLPNENIETANRINIWQSNSLQITPLELLLSIIVLLYEFANRSGYLTSEELIHVVIPLSGHKCTHVEIAQAILDYRTDPSLFANIWVAAERDNDSRIAREFLLFLHHYDFLGKRESTVDIGNATNFKEEFYVHKEQLLTIKSLIELSLDSLSSIQLQDNSIINCAIEIDEKTQVANAARERKQVEILARPNQARFRKELLSEPLSRCILSGVSIKEALQACHIIPVKNDGSDDKSNGVLLRADLHTLYDSGHITICENGSVTLSEYLKKDIYYFESLPENIEIPSYVSREAIRMRNEYRM